MRALTLAILLLIGFAAEAKYTVCTATLNSSDEIEVFKSRLNPRDFDFVELTSFKTEKDGEDGWFTNACSAGVHCDVLVVSGHFGGNFFGKSKLSLEMKTLERQSCDNRCDGIMGHLKETYLMGCNTLAEKGRDTRTPEQYLAVLVEDGIPHADAERIVAARYGPFGSSFKDRMERAFESSSIIYGFNSIGPAGQHVRTSLDQFLRRLGDYKQHLDRLDVGAARATWMDVMSPYNRATGEGLKKTNPAYVVKANSCRLQDDRGPLSERVDLAASLLRADPQMYLPTVAGFLNTSVGSGQTGMTDTANALANIRRDGKLRELFARLQSDDTSTPSIRMDLLKSERNVGWLSEREFAATVEDMFAKIAARADRSAADILCSQAREDRSLTKFMPLETIAKYAFDRPEHFKIASCAEPTSETITARAVDGYLRNRAKLTRISVEQRSDVMMSLETLPFDQARRADIFREWRAYRGPFAAEIQEAALRALFETTEGDERVRIMNEYLAYAKVSEDPVGELMIDYARNKMPHETIALTLLQKFFDSKGKNVRFVSKELLDLSPRGLEWVAQRLTTTDVDRAESIIDGLVNAGRLPPALVSALVRWLAVFNGPAADAGLTPYAVKILWIVQKHELSRVDLKMIYRVYRSTTEDLRPMLRHVLYQRGPSVTGWDLSIRTGLKLDVDRDPATGQPYSLSKWYRF